MGDDWICRCGSVFRSIGDSGDEPRAGEEDSGEDTAGRWSQEPAKMGPGANESILSDCRCLSPVISSEEGIKY